MKDKIKALLIYTVLALILTWPLLPNITTHYPSTFWQEGGDPNMYIWFMDLAAKKLVNPDLDASEMVFYPDGINYLAGYEAPIILLVSTPIILLTQNPILAYNIVLLLAFIISAFVCFYLILRLTKSLPVSLIVGFSYGFSQYMLVRGTQHVDLLLLFTLPFITITALNFLENPNKKNILFLSFAVLITGLSAWYYLVGSLIFLFILFLFNLDEFKEKPKLYLMAAVGIGSGVLLPAIPMFVNRSERSFTYVEMLIDTRGTSLLNLFLPHFYVPLWSFTSSLYGNFISPYEATSYYGIIGLVVLMIVLFMKKYSFPMKNFWITVVIVFLLIAIGKSMSLFGYTIPMPFSLLSEFIPFNRMRAPNRFFIFSYFAATVLFSYFFVYYLNRFEAKRSKILFCVLIALLLLSERFILPYPLKEIPVSDFYHNLGTNQEHFAIADIPFVNPPQSLFNFYQIYHGKPIVAGEYFWTAFNDNTFDFIKSNPLLVNSVSNACGSEFPENLDTQQVLQHLADANVKYVVVHNFLLQFQGCKKLSVFVRNFFKDYEPVFTDGELTVYSTGLDKMQQ